MDVDLIKINSKCIFTVHQCAYHLMKICCYRVIVLLPCRSLFVIIIYSKIVLIRVKYCYCDNYCILAKRHVRNTTTATDYTTIVYFVKTYGSKIIMVKDRSRTSSTLLKFYSLQFALSIHSIV